jgi:hypothetical protein
MVDRFNGIKPEAMNAKRPRWKKLKDNKKKKYRWKSKIGKKKSRNPCGSLLIIKISTKNEKNPINQLLSALLMRNRFMNKATTENREMSADENGSLTPRN